MKVPNYYPFISFTIKEIENIKIFKYQSVNDPILYKLFLRSFYKYIATFVPNYITPNQITFFGLFSMLTSLVITLYYNKSLIKTSKGLSLANFVLLFSYFSADFIDGIHARATGMCSTLGCLLDHTVDSICCFIVIITFMSTFHIRINSLTLPFLLFNILFGFYSVGLGIKYTGKYFFGYICGESEGLFFIMLIHLISFLSPNKIKFIKEKVLRYININIPVSLTLVNQIYCIIFYALHIQDQSDLSEYLISYVQLYVLLGFVFFIRGNKKASSQVIYTNLLILSQCFVCCYVEETISFLTKSKTDLSVFLFSYTILTSAIIATEIQNLKYLKIFITFFSSMHFILRLGSIVWNISQSTGVNIIF